MIGKKKSIDVQFCTEVMEASTALDGRGFDEDAEEEEARERATKNRLNNQFKNFVMKVEEAYNIEFDSPDPDLGFTGVPNRAAVVCTFTVNCLVNLTEMPFFVLTLSEVEIAYFERVQFSLKNFDLVFVFKDYSKPVRHINSIPVEHLEVIKEWLDFCDIKYYEGPQNLNWNRIMATIAADPERFHAEDGGWKFLNLESDEDESHESEAESEFEPSEEEYDSDDDDEDEDGSSGSGEEEEEYSDDDDEDEDEEEEEESGEDWDTLEEKARREDKRNNAKRAKRGRESFSDSEDEDRKPKKRKGEPLLSKPLKSKPSSSTQKTISSYTKKK